MKALRLICVTCSLYSLFLSTPQLLAQDNERFFPTWRLMSTEQKQHFIAGYLQAWKDAAQVTDIAIGYVRENPEKAVEGLQSVRGLYETNGLRPADLAHQVDRFFQDAENQSSSLSRAISAAKNNLK
jgi:hypothetical protein